MAKQLKMPDIFGQLASVKTHSYLDAPLASTGGKLPVHTKISNDIVNIWSDDISFTADEIERLDRGEIKSIFTGKLDTASMGVLGHSFGGAAAGQACLKDKRFKGFINMDGSPFGDTHNTIVNQPFMVMCNDTDKDMITAGYSPEQTNYSVVCINGARHQNFTDFSELLPTLKYLGALGSINGDRFEKIMNGYVLAFFDKYLKGKADTLIDRKSLPYSEVTVRNK